MKVNITIPEETIQQMFLHLLHSVGTINEEELKSFSKEGKKVLSQDELKEINLHLKAKKLNEPVYKILERGIEQAIDLSKYPKPTTLKLVNE